MARRSSTDAALVASRALVGVAARSLAETEDTVTLVQYRALVLLAARGATNVGSLAEALGVHQSTATRLCDRLVKRGLVERGISAQSRREVVVSLTRAGHTLLRSVTTKRRAEIDAIMVRLPAKQRAAVTDAFLVFADAAGEAPERHVETRLDDVTTASGPREFLHRSREVLLYAAIVGVATGLGVALFDEIVTRGLEHLADLPLWVIAVAPLAGLTVAAVALHVIGRDAAATADEYLLAFHDSRHRLGVRALAARMVAGIATLASGAPMGLEGPSIYLGASLGDILQHRFPRLFSVRTQRALLVAGAAAGVAAIFRAPATGAVFALEVPYQDDLARHMLGPALVASASSYLAFVAIHGTAPVLQVTGSPPFSFKDLAAAVVLGVLAGGGARAFAAGLRGAKQVAARVSPWVRVPAAAAVLVGCFVLARVLAGDNLTTGPGYGTIRWAIDPTRSAWLVAAILVLRCIATSTTVAGGGVGGLFIPLVVTGALAGRVVGGAVNALDTSLFTVVGAAAFLGAGYRVPLAAVVFVAEATGRPGFVVPGLLAAVVAELVMGTRSVTNYQRATPV